VDMSINNENHLSFHDTNHLKAFYKNELELHGDSHASVRYASRDSQWRRYDILTQISSLEDKTILDYGCGVGHLYEYLDEKNILVKDYIGIDILPEFLKISQNKFPSATFFESIQEVHKPFDFGIISGTFNDILSNNRDFWKHVVTDLFERCNEGIAFNMMSKYVDYENPKLYYEDPEYVFTFVKENLSSFVTLRHDYLCKDDTIPYEFSIYVYKKTKNKQK
jgi:SAM-dependent methyltransferase